MTPSPSTDARELCSLLELGSLVDGLIEEAQRDRLTLEAALERVLPAVAARTGARHVFLRSYDESLELRTFPWPHDAAFPHLDEVLVHTSEASRERIACERDGLTLVAQPLDVAGEWFGSVGLALPARVEAARDLDLAAALLEAFAEEVDNFLQAIRAAREKQRVALSISRVLRDASFARGLEQAARILDDEIGIEKLLVVYSADEVLAAGEDGQVHLQLHEGSRLVLDTLSGDAPADATPILAEARRCLESGDPALLRRYGLEGSTELVLESGAASGGVVGRVHVRGSRASFNTRDLDLLDDFAASIAARVVDFNKEWRTLARSFRPGHVSRLLQTPGYLDLLRPRESQVAILFADISGFTRISEQFLVEPARIGHLIDTWGREVVDVTWANGGVFDKMVGDCLVALFGPPFYELAPGARLAAAIRAAEAIVEVTAQMPRRPGLERLEGSGIGVSVGINLAPLFVGRFGPNENFTGFSAGMNNTARLQHLARKDEILVMAEGLAALGPSSPFRWGEEQSTLVKNVAQPLRYRALVRGSTRET